MCPSEWSDISNTRVYIMNGTNLVEVALNTTQPKKNTLNLKYPKSSPGSVYGCRVDWEGVQGIMLAA
jgi:hypothetical protein